MHVANIYLMKVKTIMIVRAGVDKIINVNFIIQLQEAAATIKKDAINSVFLIISSIVLLLISLILIAGYHRLKRKSEKVSGMQELEIQLKEKTLKKVSHQKDLLLHEIHHRVKNNLQVINSLLSLQSRYLKNSAALQAIRESRQRIQSMSLIHQHALGENGLLLINMQSYISELISCLREDYNDAGHIDFSVSANDIQMDIPYAMPIGLIINEAVTNSLKHAFPNKSKGSIAVFLEHNGEDNFVLSIKDDGIGFIVRSESYPSSMGINLMRGLSGDIDARFTINNNNGTTIILEFIYSKSLHYEQNF